METKQYWTISGYPLSAYHEAKTYVKGHLRIAPKMSHSHW